MPCLILFFILGLYITPHNTLSLYHILNFFITCPFTCFCFILQANSSLPPSLSHSLSLFLSLYPIFYITYIIMQLKKKRFPQCKLSTPFPTPYPCFLLDKNSLGPRGPAKNQVKNFRLLFIFSSSPDSAASHTPNSINFFSLENILCVKN